MGAEECDAAFKAGMLVGAVMGGIPIAVLAVLGWMIERAHSNKWPF